jgi:hypothetical protein
VWLSFVDMLRQILLPSLNSTSNTLPYINYLLGEVIVRKILETT